MGKRVDLSHGPIKCSSNTLKFLIHDNPFAFCCKDLATALEYYGRAQMECSTKETGRLIKTTELEKRKQAAKVADGFGAPAGPGAAGKCWEWEKTGKCSRGKNCNYASSHRGRPSGKAGGKGDLQSTRQKMTSAGKIPKERIVKILWSKLSKGKRGRLIIDSGASFH